MNFHDILRMISRWSSMLFNPFDELDQAPACSYCEAS